MNVHNHYKNLAVDEIAADYLAKAAPAAVAMSHVSSDFNFASVVRNANFFGFREVFYIGGGKKWDRRGAVGTHHYIPIHYCATFEEFFARISLNYIPIALENNVAVPMENLFTFNWPKNPCLIVGEEMLGLDICVLKQCQTVVTIPAFGTVRSINVSTAAGLAMGMYRQNSSNLLDTANRPL